MKKNWILYIAALSALLMAACSRDEMPVDKTNGFAPGETGLVMRVRSTAPGTRLLDPVPVDSLHEYRLEQYYYFIYDVDPSAEGNTTKAPVYVGKWTAPAKTDTVGTEEKIPLDKLEALKNSDGTQYSGYVYVIANYKVEETLTAWDEIIGASSPDYSTLTWTYLQSLPLPATFQTYENISSDSSLWPSEQMNAKADEGHRFKAQDSFVMDSAPTAFTVNKGEVTTIDAPLERLAVKISLDIDMAKWYVQRNNGTYKYTWYSDPKRVQVYLNYAADKGAMDGTPITYQNSGDFFTYRRFAFLPNYTKNGNEIVFPDGSYAEKEPLKWILDESLATFSTDDQGNTIREDHDSVSGETYKTSDEVKAGKIVEVDGEIQYHEYTRPAYEVSGTPFYSYPYDFSGDSGHAPFFKVIVEWTAYEESDGHIATETTEGDKNEAVIFAREFYYKITIPEVKIFQANNWYRIKLQLSTLGSEADETAIDVASDTYFVTNWSDPASAEKPDINAGRYLSITSLNHDSAGNPLFEMYGGKLEIPVSSSHAITVVNGSASYNNLYSGSTGSLTWTGGNSGVTASNTGNNFSTVPSDSHTYVELKHDLMTDLANMSADNVRDVSKITYTFTIRHTDNANYSQTVTVVQYPSIYAEAIANTDNGGQIYSSYYDRYNYDGNVFINNSQVTMPSNYNNDANNHWRYVVGISGNDIGSSTGNNNPNKYKITSSVLDPSLGFVLGDPRTDEVNNLSYTFATAPAIEGGTRTLRYYYPTEHNSSNEAGSRTYNMVAPSFINASSFGKCGPSLTYDEAVRRCAAYQEDGYPAGRWRLPTRAELQFVATLSAKKLIPQLYNDTAIGNASSIYWTAHGLKTITNGVVNDNNGTSGFARCVYDDWYWGSERAVDTKTFTWGDQPR